MAMESKIAWVLRIGAGACFIGHGAFGILTKAQWLPFFALAGIDAERAYALMPWIGAVDIALGVSVLLSPRPAALAYMAIWALWTATLRPLTGDPVWELLERAGNFGAPLALLALAQRPTGIRGWFTPLRLTELTPVAARRLTLLLITTTALLLSGHGALGVLRKPLLVEHYSMFMPSGAAAHMAAVVGSCEVIAALLLLAWPRVSLAMGVLLWKLASESLFIVDGAPIWEFVERGGSYAVPLAVLLVLRATSARPTLLSWVKRGARGLSVDRVALPLVVIGLMVPQLLHAQNTPRDSLLARLRQGGLALACRHAITDRTREDVRPLNLDDRASQRNLSADGERQARELGAAVRAARIPIGRVLSSPFFRTYESAVLAFDSATKTDSLYGAQGGAQLKLLLGRRVESGRNDVFMTHTGVLMTAFRGMGVAQLAEGDCAIVEPAAGTFTVIGKLSPSDWARFAGRAP